MVPPHFGCQSEISWSCVTRVIWWPPLTSVLQSLYTSIFLCLAYTLLHFLKMCISKNDCVVVSWKHGHMWELTATRGRQCLLVGLQSGVNLLGNIYVLHMCFGFHAVRLRFFSKLTDELIRDTSSVVIFMTTQSHRWTLTGNIRTQYIHKALSEEPSSRKCVLSLCLIYTLYLFTPH